MVKNIFEIISVGLIPFLLLVILFYGLYKKIPVYETFVDGAKEGFWVGVKIIPYLIAIMVAIAMLRASGAIDILGSSIGGFLTKCNVPVDAIPVMIVRSLSGSAALGVFSDIVNTHGTEAYVTKLTAVIIGSSETTFYVLAVYFGAVGIRKFRHALLTGILADIIGIVCAVAICNFLFK